MLCKYCETLVKIISKVLSHISIFFVDYANKTLKQHDGKINASIIVTFYISSKKNMDKNFYKIYIYILF